MAFTNALGASRTGYQNLLPRRPATPLSPTPLQLKLTSYLLSFNPRPPPLAFEAHATPVLLPAYPPLRFVPNPKLFGVCKRVFGCESIFGGFLSENHSNWYFPDTLTMELLVLLALSAAAAASPAVVTKLDAYADDSIRIRVVSQPRCPFVSSRPAPFHQHVISMRPSTRLKVPMATTQGFHLC